VGPREIRIHPGWWTPRLFPFVLVGSALLAFTVLALVRMPHGLGLCFTVPSLAIVVVGLVQRHYCRIVLHRDRIVFPQWRPGDSSEIGFTLYLRKRVPEDDTDQITTLAAEDITDWMREAGRIVLRTRGGKGHAISLSGIRERDRERIVAWLTERVGG
jgi:hypothetical protein